MNKLAVVKLVANVIVGAGTSTVTNSIIRNNVAPSNQIEAISVGVASLVIGSMASTATRAHTSAQIDQFAELINKARSSEEATTSEA